MKKIFSDPSLRQLDLLLGPNWPILMTVELNV